MLRHILTTLILLFLVQLTIGQVQTHSTCGMSTSDFDVLRQRLKSNKAFLKANRTMATSRNATTYIPLKFHLVGKDDGSERISYTRVMDQLCLMNEVFAEYELEFYVFEEFNEVDNTGIYEDHFSTRAGMAMGRERENRAINIWILGEAQLEDSVGQTFGYYTPAEDWIVIRKLHISSQGYTLPHEIGHYFSLLHTFNGWDFSPYDDTYEGMSAPERSPGEVLNECADGSNCEIAGDMICDTPADYLYINKLAFTGCEYTGTMLDPKGEPLKPDPSLIMGYFADNCIDKFTQEQVDLMKADLQSADRRAVRRGFTPSVPVINEAATLIAPIDRFVTASYNQVNLTWEAVPDATYYIVEIDNVSFFSANSQQHIVYTNSKFLDNELNPNRNYYWRVYAFNEATSCGMPSDTERFRTGLSTATSSIEAVSSLEVQPNPVKLSAGFTLSVQATASFEASIKIFNFTGQVVWSKPTHTFINGKSQELIKTKQLSPGMYFVHLENTQGIITKKIIVQE